MSAVKNSTLGDQLRKLLKEKKLSPAEAAAAVGVEEAEMAGYLEETRIPPVALLLRLSRALSIQPDSLIAAGEQKRGKDEKEETHDRRRQNYNYQLLSPLGKNWHLRSFLVAIPARSELEKVVYTHVGEEFVYVLAGRLNLRVGNKMHELAKGESFQFDSSLPHILANPGARANSLLVVVYTP